MTTGKKAAIAAYKDKKQRAGVFCIICGHSMQQWVGVSPNVDAVFNRISFTLKTGSHRSKSLTEAWASHGEAAFTFEVLDVFDPDEMGYSYDVTAKERLAQKAQELGAEIL